MKLPFLKHHLARRAAAIALALAAAAGVVAGREKPALAVVETKAPPIEQATVSGMALAKLRRAESSPPQNDPFAPRSFAPPAPPAAAGPSAAPSAPALPFRYIGKLIANGKTEVFVMRGDELISIAAGQNIDGEYRVEAITESSIAFTYLPLRTRQSIDLAEASG